MSVDKAKANWRLFSSYSSSSSSLSPSFAAFPSSLFSLSLSPLAPPPPPANAAVDAFFALYPLLLHLSLFFLSSSFSGDRSRVAKWTLKMYCALDHF
jgi:hypothetical protein